MIPSAQIFSSFKKLKHRVSKLFSEKTDMLYYHMILLGKGQATTLLPKVWGNH